MEMDFVAAVGTAGEDLADAVNVDLRTEEVGTGVQDGAGTALACFAVEGIDPFALAKDGALQGAAMTRSDAFHGRLQHFSPGWHPWRGRQMLLLRPRVAAR